MSNRFQATCIRMKASLGALVKDVPSYLFFLLQNNRRYLSLCNRNESLETSPNGEGYRCNWQWTSDLYLPKIFPLFGRWLYRRAFRDFPIDLKLRPDFCESEKPDVSFIIGHRGMERLPLLLTTLKSIAGQSGCHIECIVVEQDNANLIRKHLPEWVKYIHTPLPEKEMPYSRSWAFNVGSKIAKSDFLVFHDNDLLVPSSYANDLLKFYYEGYEVINLKRFIFYFDKDSTRLICEKGSTNIFLNIESIMQNAEGGGSIGISRQAYFDIGGFDEGFVGWGGEDNEFWERAKTKKVYPYGYLPIVHLWHEHQPEKKNRVRMAPEGSLLYQRLCNQPVEKRIRDLTIGR